MKKGFCLSIILLLLLMTTTGYASPISTKNVTSGNTLIVMGPIDDPTVAWPTDSRRLTQSFKGANVHNGIDIGALTPGVAGDNVYAIHYGNIVRSWLSQSYGEVIYLNSYVGGTYVQSRYAHLTTRYYSSGTVYMGTTIGTMGNTGRSDGVHLHFETRQDAVVPPIDNSSTPVDPISNYYPGIVLSQPNGIVGMYPIYGTETDTDSDATFIP